MDLAFLKETDPGKKGISDFVGGSAAALD